MDHKSQELRSWIKMFESMQEDEVGVEMQEADDENDFTNELDFDEQDEAKEGFEYIAGLMKGTQTVKVVKVTGSGDNYEGEVSFHFSNGKVMTYTYDMDMDPTSTSDINIITVDGVEVYNANGTKEGPDDNDFYKLFHAHILK